MFLRETIESILNLLVVRLLKQFFSLKSMKYSSTLYCNIKALHQKLINFSLEKTVFKNNHENEYSFMDN